MLTKLSELSGSKQKTITSNNIANSLFDIGKDTFIGGTVNLAVGEIAGTLIPTGDWIKPKKFVTSFIGKYATKVTGQSCIQANINTWTNVTYSYLSIKYNDGQSPTIQLFSETYVE